MDVAEAQHLMDGLDWQGAVKDIEASVNWLKANGSQKVADNLSMFLCILPVGFILYIITSVDLIAGHLFVCL